MMCATMRAASEFWLATLVKGEDGRLITSPSSSPENTFVTDERVNSTITEGATMDRAIVWDLFDKTARAADSLGTDAGFATNLRAARDRIRPLRAVQVQEGLGRDPFAGDIFFFRGRSGSLIKAIWHDGVGLSLYAKRLDRGRFVWPQTVDGVVSLTAGQMSYLLEGIDWRNPQQTWRPLAAG